MPAGRALGLAAAFAALVTAAPSLPALPQKFEAIVEANIVNRNYSLVLHEYYDYDLNAEAMHFISPRGNSYSLRLGQLDLLLAYGGDPGSADFPSGCAGIRMTSENARGFDDVSMHVESTSEWLAFGGNRREVYEGQSSARGIRTDVWRSSDSSAGNTGTRVRPGEPANSTYHVNFTLEHHFAAEGWENPGTEDLGPGHPVRVRMLGNRTIFPADGSAALVFPFDHVYEYVKFHRGSQDGTYHNGQVFQPPAPTYTRDSTSPFYDPAVYNYTRMCDITLYCREINAILADPDHPSTIPGGFETHSLVCGDQGGLDYSGRNEEHFYNAGVDVTDASDCRSGSDSSDSDSDSDSDIESGSDSDSNGGHSDGALAGAVLASIVGGVLTGAAIVMGFQRIRSADRFHVMQESDEQL